MGKGTFGNANPSRGRGKALLAAVAAVALFACAMACAPAGITGDADALSDEGSSLASGGSATLVSASLPAGESYAAGEVLLGVGEGYSRDALEQALEAAGATLSDVSVVSGQSGSGQQVLRVRYEGGADALQVADALAGMAGVETAEPNFIRQECGEVDTSAVLEEVSTPQWHLDAVNAQTAWNTQKSSGAVTVVVIDSGVDTDNADLAGNLLLDYAYNGASGNVGSAAVEDETGHGTWVTSVIAAQCENGVGTDGVSYNAKVLPVRASAEGETTMEDSAIIAGIDYVIGLKEAAATPELANIRVINLSLGGKEYGTLFEQAVQRAQDAGILVVASAGNEASAQVSYPAAYDGVIGVSAVKQAEGGGYEFDSSYSNYGEGVTLSAPGTKLKVVDRGGSLVLATGTSFASPVVSGIAALLFASDMTLPAQEVAALLTATATDLGDEGWDEYYGYGMVDAAAALAARGSTLYIDIPEGCGEVEYTGRVITGVKAGFGYALTGDFSATDCGTYSAVATLAKGYYRWSDGTSAPKTITWTITQPTFIDVDDTYRSYQWNLDAMNVPEAWAIQRDCSSVTIGIVSSGVDTDNPDLSPNLLSDLGYYAYGKQAGASYVFDEVGAGTRMASIISSVANNGSGIAGVSYNAKILPLKDTFDSTGSAWSGDTQGCVEYAINLKKAAKTEEAANLRILIIGSYGWDNAMLNDAIDAANDAGLTVIRFGSAGYKTMSDRSGEIVVSGVTVNDAGEYVKIDESTYGPSVSVCAPADQVPCYNIDGEVVLAVADQRAAAANVAAVAAMLYAQNPDLTAAEVKQIIQETATDLGDEGRDDYYGYGMVNAHGALTYNSGKVKVDAPVAEEGLVYTGSEQVGVHEGPGYYVTGGTATSAGTYTATATLISSDYCWSDGSRGAKKITWSIAKRKTAMPTISASSYTGNPQSAEDSVNPGSGGPGAGGFGEGITASGDLYATQAGTYTITLTLDDPSTCWEDGTTGPKTIRWRIEKARNEITGLSLEGWVVGDSPNEPTCTAKFGTPVYSYGSSPNGPFASTVPSTSGTWYVRAFVPQTSNYVAAEAVAEFSITGEMAQVPVPAANLQYTGELQVGLAAGAGYTCSGTCSAVDAGTYQAVATLADGVRVWSDGTTAPKVIEWSIAPARNGISGFALQGWTYGDEPNQPTAQARFGEVEFTYGSSADGEFSAEVPTQAGTWWVRAHVQGTGNYSEASEVLSFAISPKQVSEAVVSLAGDLYFNGQAQEQAVVAVCVDGVLVDSYAVSDNVQTNAGSYKMKIAFSGNYAGSVLKEFRIYPASLGNATVTVSDCYYTGSALCPEPMVVLNGVTLLAGRDYTASWRNNVDVGLGEVAISGTGNYQGVVGQAFGIKYNMAEASAEFADIVRHITDEAHPAQADISFRGNHLWEGQDYQILYNGEPGVPQTAGSYAVSAMGLGNYSGTIALGTMTLYAQAPVKCDGTRYHIASAAADGLVLDVANAMPVKGSNVSIWSDNGGANQLFTFAFDQDMGYYTLYNVANDTLVLDAAGSVPKSGSNVSTWTYNGGYNQRWIIESNEDGSLTFRCAANVEYVLDADANPPVSGANVRVWKDTDAASQRWQVESAMNLADAQVSASGMARMECGSALEADVSVTLNGIELEAGEDFLVYYEGAGGTEYARSTEAPSAAGTYKVSAEGAGLYHGTVEAGTMSIYAADSVKADGTRYHAKSLASSASGPDFVLDVANVDPVKGSNVSIWKDNSGANQLFTFELGDDGYYVIRNARNTELVLDAAGAEPEIGANVSTWSENGGLNQKWVVIPAAAGGCFIASAYDASFVLDAAGDEPVIGANVSIWTAKSDASKNRNQRWEFLPAMDVSEADFEVGGLARIECGSPRAAIVEGSLNGLVLVEGRDFAVYYEGVDGTEYARSADAPSAAGWYRVTIEGLDPYCGSYDAGTLHIYSAAAPSAGKVYRIHSAVDDNFVLDVANKQPVKGSNVSVWTSNGGDNQLFTLEDAGGGYYVLRNVANPQLVLDAAGSSPAIGANVSTWTYNGGPNQKWRLAVQLDGTYALQSAFDSSFVLDAAGKQPSIGANVSIWTDNGGANQHWTFEEIPQA